MKAVIETWWRGLSDRERRLVAVMLVLLSIVIAWLGVIRPIDMALDRAQERHARALTALADVRAARADLAQLGQRPTPPLDEPLVTFVGRLASEAGLTLTNLEGQGTDRVALTVTAVRAPAFLGWVQNAEVRHGLVVDSLTATRNDDSTVAVQAVLRRPVR